MTQAGAKDSSRTGFLFDGWRTRALATLGYLLMIAGLIGVASTDAHLDLPLRRPAATQAVTAPAAPVALDLAADRP